MNSQLPNNSDTRMRKQQVYKSKHKKEKGAYENVRLGCCFKKEISRYNSKISRC